MGLMYFPLFQNNNEEINFLTQRNFSLMGGIYG